MPEFPAFNIDDGWVRSLRGAKNGLDPARPYALLLEPEMQASGHIEHVLTVFLSNRECPFSCLMCDLWQNTTDVSVSAEDITAQISWALAHSSPADHIKLYNAGSFFDPRAIPPAALPEIASLVSQFKSVIIESHPKFIDGQVPRFQEQIHTKLQVAIGLETVQPQVLSRLNKKMTLDEVAEAIAFLRRQQIDSRAFIILRPPFLSELEGIEWAKKSILWAFENGVGCCCIIPARAGNGAMDYLQRHDLFSQPRIQSLEEVVEFGLSLNQGLVLADLWDLQRFSTCDFCFNDRKKRLEKQNLTQKLQPQIHCESCLSSNRGG